MRHWSLMWILCCPARFPLRLRGQRWLAPAVRCVLLFFQMQDPEEMEKSSSGPAALPLSGPNSEFVKASIVCVLLAIIVWVAFGQMRRHEFINYDDAEYIKENVNVLRGLNWPY